MDGNKRNAVDKLSVGDIGVTIKLKNTFTNDTLSISGTVTIKPITYPEVRVTKSIFAKDVKEDEKLFEVP